LLLVGLVGLSLLALSLFPEAVGNTLKSAREGTLIALQEMPWTVYFGAFVLLPALGFPLTFFYLTVAGVVQPLPLAIACAWVAVLGNMTISFLLVRYGLNDRVEQWFARRDKSIPRIDPQSQWRTILLWRASPTPWLLQNIILALGGASLVPYLAWSLPLQGAIGATIIVVGDSALDGRLGLALGALFFVLLLSFLTRSLWKRFNGTGGREA